MRKGLIVSACIAYWALLTLLLLAPDPARVVGLRRAPVPPWGDVGIHFSSFTFLALLVQGARWPKSASGWLIAVLVAYGIATESLQALVPSRRVELADYAENILGVLAGSGLYLVLRRAWRPPSPEAVGPPL